MFCTGASHMTWPMARGELGPLAESIFELLLGTFLRGAATKLSVLAVRTGVLSLCKAQWEEKQ